MTYFTDDVFKTILSYCDDTIERKQKKHMKNVVSVFKELREIKKEWNEENTAMFGFYGPLHEEQEEIMWRYFIRYNKGCVYYDRGEFCGEGEDWNVSNELKMGKWIFGYGYFRDISNMCPSVRNEFRDLLVSEGYDYFEF